MKKVLFFIESLSGGGAEKVLSDIVCNLDTTKYDITVCTVTDEDIYQKVVSNVSCYKSFLRKKDYRAGGIKKIIYWMRLKLIYFLPASLIYRFYIKEKYDIEIAFVEGFSTKVIASSSNRNSKKIAWVHTNMSQNKYADTYYKSLKEHKDAYRVYDTIVCVSQSVKKEFEMKFFESEEILVQYNPVDSRKIIRDSEESINLKSFVRPLLGTIGRLEPVKGYMRLLKCAKRLYEEGYIFEIWIIGDGSQREILEQYIEKNNIMNSVKLLGFQSNPYKYISKCDAFICSSYTEGFSTAATESMVIRIPIFTVECSGMKELFGDIECGEIVENTDEALYYMLKKIVTREVSLDSYKRNLQIRSKEFIIENRIREIERLLDAIL